MRELFIVRHGETEWNVVRRMQGRLDSPLTEQGKAHAQKNGQLLRSIRRGRVDSLADHDP